MKLFGAEIGGGLGGRAPRGARGLKLDGAHSAGPDGVSRPARGAWIETIALAASDGKEEGRAPRGARGLKLALA